jgi:hypothetical protein
VSRGCLIVAFLAAALAWPGTAGAAYTDGDYLRYADRLAGMLDSTWDPALGYYTSTSSGIDSRYNAAMLVVHATAAAVGHQGPARNDARARRLAQRLTEEPPFYTGLSAPWADRMFHTPGWVGNMVGTYEMMDKAIDPKIAEGLVAAWAARDAIGLPQETTARIADEISRVAYAPFFRYPNVRLNQINWPAELYAYEAAVSGTPELLLTDYRRQMLRFVRGVRRPWDRGGATNLSPSYRFHYQINIPARSKRNLDSAEYANITLHFLSFYDEAVAAGMKPLPLRDRRLLRGWVQRALFGYWLHSGFMNWDTGLSYRRWMQGKSWAYAMQGLMTIATSPRFQNRARFGPWAKAIFDHALDFYVHQEPAGGGLTDSALFGVEEGEGKGFADTRMLAARMAAHAMRAMAAGLGRMPAEEPPPFYAFDSDVGRLAVSTPRYGTALVVVTRGAVPYGGIELARLHDSEGDPVGGVGARVPAAFGVQVRDARGRHVFATGAGLHEPQDRPPLRVRLAGRKIGRVARHAASPPAGPFRTLEAVGRRRTRELSVTTRHRFRPRSIEESWTVRRRNGRRRLSVGVLFPSWGAAAVIDAELRDGTLVRLGRMPLRGVRRFHIRSTNGTYTVRPLGRAAGVAEALAVATQRSAPTPGPTLRLTIRRGARFETARLRARITPR